MTPRNNASTAVEKRVRSAHSIIPSTSGDLPHNITSGSERDGDEDRMPERLRLGMAALRRRSSPKGQRSNDDNDLLPIFLFVRYGIPKPDLVKAQIVFDASSIKLEERPLGSLDRCEGIYDPD